MKKRNVLIALVSAMVLSACASTPAPSSITDIAARTPQLSTLNKLIVSAGLTETLSGPGPFTVFAPTDDAFKAVPAATMTALANDKEQLKAVLTYHVIEGKLTSTDVKTGPAKTVQGSNVSLSKAGTFVTVEDAVVTQADIGASNGVVHVIDRVLLPPIKR